MWLRDRDSDWAEGFADHPGYRPIAIGLEILSKAEEIHGHNIIQYDLTVLKKLRGWTPRPEVSLRDTYILSKLAFPTLYETDGRLLSSGRIDRKSYGSHSLRAWGQRLNNNKADYTGGWETFNPEMFEYCGQDTAVAKALLAHCLSLEADKYGNELPRFTALAEKTENDIHAVCCEMVHGGFPLNKDKAVGLYGGLVKKRQEVLDKISESFGAFWKAGKEFTPKSDNKRYSYTAGAPFTKVELLEFNPNSNQHITTKLKQSYGWEPKVFTPSGDAKVDDDILQSLPYPEAQLCGQFKMVEKRISTLADSDQAWLKIGRDERHSFVVHGEINPNGTVTGRASHFKPNLGAVPAVDKPYGPECRELFEAGCDPQGVKLKLVGADQSGIELRMLAHYLSAFDDGEYITEVLKGDPHTKHMIAIGASSRGIAKTFIYAYLYGSGDLNLGSILDATLSLSKQKAAGKQARLDIESSIRGLDKMQDKLGKALESRPYLIGIDGRRLYVRKDYSKLNTLLQAAGAAAAKAWVIKQRTDLQDAGIPSWLRAWVHDETQTAIHEENAEAGGKLIVQASLDAGDMLGFKLPIAAEYKIGENWRDTH